jgi:carbamoyltransferase
MIILGINAYHGDAAAAIIDDGRLVAAAEEERFNRRKHCAGFPIEAIRYCLQVARVGISEVDHIGISRDPSAHLHKKVLFATTRAARSLTSFDRAKAPGVATKQRGIFDAVAERLANAAKVRDLRAELAKQLGVAKNGIRAEFHNIEHHRAHLASSFFVSPFERAALLSIDGFGDFISTMWGIGEGNAIDVLGQVEYPHSTGIVYTATTQFIGFPHYGDEGKVMGLAPYGKPRFMEEFRDIIRTEEDGHFKLNLDYFRHHAEGVEMTWDDGSPVIGRIFSDDYSKLFGPPREPGVPLTEREHDIAASLQLRLEEVGFHILNHLHEATGLTDLGLSGGVAYNSVMNGKILLQTPFRRVFVQPAAGDSGTAIGVCYQIYNAKLDAPRGEVMAGAYTGPEFSDDEIRAELKQSGLHYETYSDQEVTRRAARDIADGAVMGWFQGRMEFGPRALGARSIVASPLHAAMQARLNDIKDREDFRPVAPVVLEERAPEWFVANRGAAGGKDGLCGAPRVAGFPAPFMLFVFDVRPDKAGRIPAVRHVDGTARVQTINRAQNPRYYDLLKAFERRTGVPVLVNTSFNTRGEPMVCTPRDAVECFWTSPLDALVIGSYLLEKRPRSP